MGNFVAFYDVRDAGRYTGLTRPSWLVGNPRPVPVSYRSHREANARLYVVRQLGEPWLVEWRTAAVPDHPGPRIAFAFTAATGWTTEPSGHFTLHLNGRPLLRFNLPETAPAAWRSDDGTAELTFDVRESGIDQFGVMCLSVDASRLEPGKPARLKVTGSASGSRRWFGLYDYTDTLNHERGKLPVGEARATLVNGYAGLVRWLSGDTGSVAGIARLRGTTDELPEFVEHSRKLQALCRKLNTEAARRSPEIDGYTLWLLQDYWKGGQGLLNQFYEPKGVSAEDSLTRNAETVILLDRDRCALRGGSRLEAAAVVSHFGASPLNDPVLDVTLLDETGHAVHHRRHSLDDAAAGTVAQVADLRVPVPDLPEPSRYRLQLDLADGKCRRRNAWDFWAFPEPAPVPGIRGVAAVSGAWLEELYPGIHTLTYGEPLPEGVDTVIVAALSRGVLEGLARGRRVLLLSTDAFVGDRLRFKSPWWFPQPQDSNLGTIVRHHPALGDFPHEGWCDLVWFDMVEGSQAVHHQGGLSRVPPIIQAIDLPLRQLTRSLLFEARVGEGRLLACSLNLTSQVLGRDPAARQLLDCLLRYTQSDRFAPDAELSPEELRQAVSAADRLDSTLVEGFARVVAAAPDPHSGQTETYGPPELSVRGERVASWFARERDDTRFVTWQTASAPAAVDTPTVTFVWTGVLGWKDEPEGVLRLYIGETAVVDFDVTDQAGEWTSADGQVRLCFSPGVHNGADTLGTFALELPAGQVKLGEPLTLTVRAYGGSRRWFAVQEYTDTLDWLVGLR